ncbi:membrane protein [Mesorhizobium sp. L2C066B000]|nr:membrane protein [Mesorhizobium sp. L2C066B000]
MGIKFEKLNKLRESLLEANHDFRASTQLFNSLDVAKIDREMDLEGRGTQRGEANQPPKTAKNFDDIEHTVIERVEDEKKAAHHTLEDSLQLLSGRLAGLDFEEQFGLIRQANAASVSDFKASIAVGLDELHGLRKSLNDAEKEHDWFKQKHGLVRAVRVQHGAAHVFRVSLLIFLFLIETAMNGNFLAKGNEQGFFGGLLEAAAFSFLNIGAALLFAIFCARLVTHRSLFVKLIGALSIVAYIGLALTINLALAHYREASGSFVDGAGVEVVRSMLANPAGLMDVKSWLLFGIGLMFSIFAFIDGWFVLDPYPGYAGVENRLVARREDYIERKSELIEALQEVRDEHNEKVEDIVKRLGSRRREHRAIIDHRSRLLTLFAQHQDQLERACNQLLSKYREANFQARTEPAPKHFATPYKLERIKPLISSDDEWSEKDLGASIRDAQEELNAQVRLIGLECERGIEQYRDLDKLHPDSVNG